MLKRTEGQEQFRSRMLGVAFSAVTLGLAQEEEEEIPTEADSEA